METPFDVILFSLTQVAIFFCGLVETVWISGECLCCVLGSFVLCMGNLSRVTVTSVGCCGEISAVWATVQEFAKKKKTEYLHSHI